jgi:hypothetical protein
MPKVSKATASHVQDFGPAIDHAEHLEDYTVDFVSIRQTHSLAPLLQGLPGDSCQCPHWGYLFTGKLTVAYVDRPDEVYEGGDAFYLLPGHVPAAEAGSEFVQFSPKDQLAEVQAAMMANAQKMTAAGS